ncbi:MAG: M15 family metallopeptidase [Phormidesmis sp.]
MKPYQSVPIQDCGEPLVPIPLDRFAVVTPHPYAALGAPYGRFSPYFLRQRVLQKLTEAQTHLQVQRPDWRLQIFDAYRPIPVQQFMVDYTFTQLARSEGLNPAELNEVDRSQLQEKVLKFWAIPSPDPTTPPPHSTGAAVDLTLVNAAREPVNMGSAIDEISPRSYPDHFADSTDPKAQRYHQHRQLLNAAMNRAGFCQHPNEWWHFSWGDQLWAWQVGREVAQYGKAQTS